VALLLDQRPGMTPVQVKALLRQTASPLPLADAAGRGAGQVNLAAAGLTPTPLAGQVYPRSTGTGLLEAARGSSHVADGDVELTGEMDFLGPWNGDQWAKNSTDGSSWVDGRWNYRDWTGDCWCATSWSGPSWSGRTWAGRTWAGNDWAGRTWAGGNWS
jgi:serine protease AprX